jgi:hypothetical protein
MECVENAAEGTFNFFKDLNTSTYNVSQTCGCVQSAGWNCTTEDYPISDLQKVRFNTTDYMYSLTGRNISQFRLVTFDNTTQTKDLM